VSSDVGAERDLLLSPEDTVLNSKKWRYASFINRVKRQVAEHWHPEDAYRRRDPTGAVYGRQSRDTELRIQLKPDGHIANIAVTKSSGLEFLDNEAIEAFKAAQPFPNPPRQLIDADGLIKFPIHFVFDLSGPPRTVSTGQTRARDGGAGDGRPDQGQANARGRSEGPDAGR
jgi:TonB family protein